MGCNKNNVSLCKTMNNENLVLYHGCSLKELLANARELHVLPLSYFFNSFRMWFTFIRLE